MASITTRVSKGSALTVAEMDANFTNLNTELIDKLDTNTSLPAIQPSLLLDFISGGSLDPRITFSRPTSGTYYDGVTVAKAEENLLRQSQALGASPWLVDGVTVTSNTTAAPDGTTTADTITVSSGVFKKVIQYGAVSAGVTYTFSVYVQGGTSTAVTLYAGGFTVSSASISGPGTLGSLGSSGLVITALSTSQWTRVSMTFTASSSSTASEFNIYPGNWSSQSVGDSVIAWGAQLEQRDFMGPYVATTDSAVIGALFPRLLTAPAGVPRIDHDPVTGQRLGLLIEEGRTNGIRWSQDFSANNWTKVGITLTPGSVVAPDGSVTGSVVTMTASGYVLQSVTTVNGANASVSGSIYIKNVNCTSSDVLTINLSDGVVGTITMNFKPLDGSFVVPAASNSWSSVSRTVTNVGNGWWRIIFSGTTTQWTSGWLEVVSSNSGRSYAIWGAQIEAGSVPTSYIPTGAAAVTRAADDARALSLPPWFNYSEGTICADFVPAVVPGTAQRWVFNIGANANNGSGVYFNAGDSPSLSSGVSNTGDAQTVNVITRGVATRSAVSYAGNDSSISLNGGAVATGINFGATAAVTAQALSLGHRGNFTRHLNGHLRRLAYYPRRVSNAALQALTL